MLTRRDTMKLAAAGLLIPSARVFAETGTPVASPAATPVATPGATPVATQPSRGSWPMIGGNPARSGVFPGPIPSLEQPIIVRWRYEPEDDWISREAPIMADGRAYLKADRNIYAINIDNGLEYWRFELSNVYHLTVADGVVYATTANGTIHAISAESGLEMWRYSDSAATGDGTPTSSDSSFLSPAVVDGNVIVSGNSAVLSLDALTGDLIWRFATQWWSTHPVVAGGLVLTSNDGGISALDLHTGQELWRSSTGEGVLAVVGNIAIAGQGWAVSGLDLETGQELWRQTYQDIYDGSLAIGASHLLFTSFRENDYGTYSGEVQAIDIETGSLLWMLTLGDINDTWDTEMRVVEDQLFVKIGEPDNQLLVIDVNTGLKTWEYRGYIARIDPVAVDNNLYFVHDGELFAIGNLLDPTLLTDVTLRAAPAPSGLQRGTASAGDVIDHVGGRAESDGELWVEISVGGVMGWIPASAIDPATLPPEGDVWVIYDPSWF